MKNDLFLPRFDVKGSKVQIRLLESGDLKYCYVNEDGIQSSIQYVYLSTCSDIQEKIKMIRLDNIVAQISLSNYKRLISWLEF